MGTIGSEAKVPHDRFWWILGLLLGCLGVSLVVKCQVGVFLSAVVLLGYVVTWSIPTQLYFDFVEDKFKNCTQEEIQYDFHTRSQELPPQPFPNGWAIAVEVRDVPVDGKRAFRTFGKHLLFFRGRDPHVVYQKCPNSGADLSRNGTVHGDVITCDLCERPKGSGCGQPGEEFRELHGFVYLWHHGDGIGPTWEPTHHANLVEEDLAWKGTSYMTVACHPQDVAENVADDGHINFMHTSLSMAGVLGVSRNWFDYKKIMRLQWALQWKKSIPGLEKEGELGEVTSFTAAETTVLMFGVPVVRMPGVFHNEGPYYAIDYINLWGARMAVLFSVMPESHLRTIVITSVFGGKYTPLVPRILAEEFCQVQRDGVVWNSKVHKRSPIWVKEWQQLSHWRRWYSQFYSEGTAVGKPRCDEKEGEKVTFKET